MKELDEKHPDIVAKFEKGLHVIRSLEEQTSFEQGWDNPDNQEDTNAFT